MFRRDGPKLFTERLSRPERPFRRPGHVRTNRLNRILAVLLVATTVLIAIWGSIWFLRQAASL